MQRASMSCKPALPQPRHSPELQCSCLSKTPGVYLDPHGWGLALEAYHNHDKKCPSVQTTQWLLAVRGKGP